MSGDADHRPVGIDEENPFPGLDAFREYDRKFFYGRANETADLLRHVRRAVLTVLFGASGLGKTSLLQAGLFPRLRDRSFLPVLVRLDHGRSSGGLAAQVRQRLAEECARHEIKMELAEDFSPGPETTLWEHFHRIRLWNEKNRLMTPVLVFDQFEEIFTLGAGDERTQRFRTELEDLVENRVPKAWGDREVPFPYARQNLRVVIALREDFLAHLEGLAAGMPSLATNRFRLTRMNGERALEAVLGPGGKVVSPEVATAIVRFAAGAGQRGRTVTGIRTASEPVPPDEAVEGDSALGELSVEPSLLSLFSRELNERRKAQESDKISHQLLEESRGEILSGFYRRSLRGFRKRHVGRFIETRLITAGGFRTSVALDDALAEPGVTRDAIDVLVQRRLLRREERFGTPHIELIHDVLCPTVHEVAERQAARRRRRRRLLGAGIATALILGLAGLVYYFRSLADKAQRESRLALAGQLVAESVSTRARGADMESRENAARLALEAIWRFRALGVRSTHADEALRNALDLYLQRRWSKEVDVSLVELNAEGTEVIAAGGNTSAHVYRWDVADGRELPEKELRGRPVGFSPGGEYLVTLDRGFRDTEGELRVYETATGREGGPPIPFVAREVQWGAVSPGGDYVAMGRSRGSTQLRRVADGEEVRTFLDVSDLAFDFDGNYLLVAASDPDSAGLWEMPEYADSVALERCEGSEVLDLGGTVDRVEFRRDRPGSFVSSRTYLGGRVETTEVNYRLRRFGNSSKFNFDRRESSGIDGWVAAWSAATIAMVKERLLEIKYRRNSHFLNSKWDRSVRFNRVLLNSWDPRVRLVALGPEGRLVATIFPTTDEGSSTTVSLWELRSLDGENELQLYGNRDGGTAAVFGPGGEELITAAATDRYEGPTVELVIQHWDLATWKESAERRSIEAGSFDYGPLEVAFDRGGKHVGVAGPSRAMVFDVKTGKERAGLDYSGEPAACRKLFLTAEGWYLLTAEELEDPPAPRVDEPPSVIRLRELRSGREFTLGALGSLEQDLGQPVESNEYARCPTWREFESTPGAPRSRFTVSRKGDRVSVRNSAGQEIAWRTVENLSPGASLMVTPDGRYLVYPSLAPEGYSFVQRWDLDLYEEACEMLGEDPAKCGEWEESAAED